MDIERLLISRTLRDSDLQPAMQARVRPDWFEDADSRRCWQWVLEYWNKYGDVPTASALKSEYPTYRLIKSDDPLQYLIDELRNRRRYVLLQDGLLSSIEHVQDDRNTDEALRVIQTAIAELSVETAGDIDTNLLETIDDRMKYYEELRRLPNGLRGYPTGFTTIDEGLSGLQKQQLITVLGLPKSGKSTMLLKMAMSCHASAEQPVVLFVGFEMSNREQEARYDAMAAQINHQRLLNGKLTDAELSELEETLMNRKNKQPFYLSSDITSSQTISGLRGKLDQYRPDVLFIDGVYMMLDEVSGEHNTPQALTSITRGLKRMAQSADIPIVMSTQALGWKVSKKKGLTSDATGYSSSFLQDSDVVLGIESQEDVDNIKKLSVLDARSAPRLQTMITWNWETGTFSEGETTDTAADMADKRSYASSRGKTAD